MAENFHPDINVIRFGGPSLSVVIALYMLELIRAGVYDSDRLSSRLKLSMMQCVPAVAIAMPLIS